MWLTSPNSNDGRARNGPSLDEIRAAYADQHSLDEVTIDPNHQGYQQWTVPASRTYRIVAVGAQGGGSTGVNAAATNGFPGAKIAGTFELTAGQVLTVVVGTAGGTARDGHGDSSSSSNGGSFVVSGGQPLIVAGGGAGTWSTQYGGNCDGSLSSDGRAQGQAGEDAATVNCGGAAPGGTGGSGGYDGLHCVRSRGFAGGGFINAGRPFASGLVGGNDGNDNDNDDSDGAGAGSVAVAATTRAPPIEQYWPTVGNAPRPHSQCSGCRSHVECLSLTDNLTVFIIRRGHC